jgi:hypothetical protein
MKAVNFLRLLKPFYFCHLRPVKTVSGSVPCPKSLTNPTTASCFPICLKGANGPNTDEIFNKLVPDDDSAEYRRMSDTGLFCRQTLLEYEVQPVDRMT